MALANDLALRTEWTVQARAPGFTSPPARGGRSPDVVCERGGAERPMVLEVELPETLVRRDTVSKLRTLVDGGLDARLVMIADEPAHADAIDGATRLLRRVGLEIPVAALAPRSETLTGADW